MIDNFDSNVARRKPNTADKVRPTHPWDVPKNSPVEDVEADEQVSTPSPFSFPHPASTSNSSENTSDDSLIVPESSASDVSVKKPPQKKAPSLPGSQTFLPGSLPVSQKKSSLSDSINIHSNYCKLDNDVSDFLLPKLSPSAQCVYLRLYRQSYGWNRNWAAESLPKLTEYCNLSLQTVRKAIKELEIFGCIRKEFSDYHKATVYRIFLPSDIGMGKSSIANNTLAYSRGQNINSHERSGSLLPGQIIDGHSDSGQIPVTNSNRTGEYQFLEGNDNEFRGQNIFIQSLFFRGTSISSLLESGGSLPKNILTYMNETHLSQAVDIIDEFYDSIGFSIVSRSLYRKSLLDYFDMIKSGFSSDDIRYAVRWTYKNSRSRPESFSLIKHTLHLAMNDLIQDLKSQSAEKGVLEEKQVALQKNMEWRNSESMKKVSAEDLQVWQEVVEDLRMSLNEHSFAAFIEPLRLDSIEGEHVFLSAPPDSVSWVSDHYSERIRACYRDRTGKEISVVVR
jgi:hypothetical protein